MPYAGFETLFGIMLSAARRNLFTVMLNVIMLSVLLLIVLMLSVVMLCRYAQYRYGESVTPFTKIR
jgi:tetrahydromethanopterin S-methyltransferase subunit D